jgi:hypothetical protein
MSKISLKKIMKRIDLLDTLFIFVLVIIVSLVFLSFNKEQTDVYVYLVNDFEYWQENPPSPAFWISNSINQGDKVYTMSKNYVGDVVSIENIDWGGRTRSSQVKLKLSVLYDVNKKHYSLDDQLLAVGKRLELYIGDVKYEGVISYFGDQLDPPQLQKKYIEVDIYVPEVEPWIANSYDNTFIVKDTSGIEIFRIKNSLVSPAEKSIETESGRIVRSKDPFFKDVRIRARLQVRCQEEVCYFNGVVPIKIGGNIWAQARDSYIPDDAQIIAIH